MKNNNETVAEVLAEFGKNIELMRKCKCVGVSLWNCLKFKLRFEVAHNRELSAEQKRCGEILRDQIAEVERAAEKVAEKDREIAELRECLRIIRDNLLSHTIKSADGKYVNNGAFLSEEFVDDERWRKALEGGEDVH